MVAQAAPGGGPLRGNADHPWGLPPALRQGALVPTSPHHAPHPLYLLSTLCSNRLSPIHVWPACGTPAWAAVTASWLQVVCSEALCCPLMLLATCYRPGHLFLKPLFTQSALQEREPVFDFASLAACGAQAPLGSLGMSSVNVCWASWLLDRPAGDSKERVECGPFGCWARTASSVAVTEKLFWKFGKLVSAPIPLLPLAKPLRAMSVFLWIERWNS